MIVCHLRQIVHLKLENRKKEKKIVINFAKISLLCIVKIAEISRNQRRNYRVTLHNVELTEFYCNDFGEKIPSNKNLCTKEL